MYVDVIRATPAHLEACCKVFDGSTLYDRYFAGSDRLPRQLELAVGRKELYLAVSPAGDVLGAMWIEFTGFFGAFPYLALLGVRQDKRGTGIGHTLLRVYEEVAKALGYRKVSLMVSHFNPRAKSLYQSMGYRKAAYLENIFRDGIHESIMIKQL